MKKKVTILFCLLLIFGGIFMVNFQENAHAEAVKNISGIVSLPNNEVAPAGGIKIMISGDGDVGGYKSTNVTIAAGAKSASYTLSLPQNIKDQAFRISYSIQSEGNSYISSGYYGGASYSEASWVDLSSNNIKNINIALLKGKKISGTISLPDKKVAPAGGIEISVDANSDSKNVYTDTVIPAGKNSASYTVCVPTDAENQKWQIEYSIYSNGDGYVNDSYYGGNISPKLVDTKNGDVKDINIAILKGKAISGKISLPNNEVAPAGGRSIYIYAENDNSDGEDTYVSTSTSIEIPEGKNSAQYTIYVPEDVTKQEWRVSYSLDFDGYVNESYYGGIDYDSATLVNTAKGSVDGINIVLLKGNVISGTISLPNKEVASSKGMRISINAEGESGESYSDVVIPPGRNSASYTLYVPKGVEDQDWKVRYYIDSSYPQYVREGYYGGSSYESATLVNASSGNVKGINISIFKAKTISGNISLPNNAVAPTGGMSISVNASNSSGNGYGYASVTIPEGKNSVSYELGVSSDTKDTKWRVSYYISSNASGYISNGYYGGNDYNSAKLVDIASGDAKNINISLIKAKVISGNISLPNNAVAPAGGMSISVNASNSSGSGYANVTIPAGKNSVPYEIAVSPNAKDTTWRISYYINSNGSGYVSNGYYGGSDYSSAKLVNVSSGDAKNINISLIKAKVISGNISLPNNAVAPAGGMSISVNASNSSGSGYANVTIPAGKNSVPYEIAVSPNAKDTTWRISYYINSNGSGYVSNGYYGGSDYSSAKLVDVASGNAKNINISLIKANIIPDNGVTGVTLSKTTDVLKVGGTDTLVATVLPATATNKNVMWTTSNSNVATVDKNGKITAVGTGTAKITVTTANGSKTSVCNVTVNPAVAVTAVTGVTLNKTTDVLKVGGTDTLVATVLPATATNKNVIWTTSNSNVATVDKTGKITAVGTGTAKITVTTENGSKTSVCNVTVNPAVAVTAVTGVTLNKTTDVLKVGGTDTLVATVLPTTATNKNVIWTTSNINVATVDKTGKITAVGTGTAKITVTTENGSKTSVCNVTVNPAVAVTAVTGVTLNKTTDVLKIGGTDTLVATVLPATATNKNVMWTTSNINVATVDKTGKITAVGTGTAKITVTTENGSKTSVCNVTVNPAVAVTAVTGVTLNKTTDVLKVGGTDTLVATVAPATATNKNVMWTTSNSNVATVDKTGKITAVGTGTAKITVTTANGSKTSVCNVTVNPAVAVTLSKK